MAKDNNVYVIPFQELEEGIHKINFTIQKEFIELQQIENMLDISAKVQVIISKRSQLHTVDFVVNGTVTYSCDRCLEPVIIKIKSEQQFVVKVKKLHDEFSDEENVILITQDQKEIDITHVIYENVILSIPIKKVHKIGMCNSEMLQFLSKEEIIEIKTDPRWDALNKLKTN